MSFPSFTHQIAQLSAEHDRADFCSGSEPLDRYLRERANQDFKRYVKAYLHWCGQQSVDPAAAKRSTIKLYRHYLIGHGYGRNTIALKLAAVRRFYDRRSTSMG